MNDDQEMMIRHFAGGPGQDFLCSIVGPKITLGPREKAKRYASHAVALTVAMSCFKDGRTFCIVPADETPTPTPTP